MKRAKLSLKKESLRSLNNESLESVGGGGAFTTRCLEGGYVSSVWVPPYKPPVVVVVVGP